MAPIVDFQTSGDTTSSNTQLGVFVPFALEQHLVAFGDLRVAAFGDSDAQVSFGVGVRRKLGADVIVGANAYYDLRHTALGHNFQQLSAGAEAFYKNFEIRANGYLPVGQTSGVDSESSRVFTSNGTLRFRQGKEVAMYGVDAEVGVRIPVLEDSGSTLNFFGGGFWLSADQVDDITGIKGRAELALNNLDFLPSGASLTLGAQAQYSNERLDGGVFARLSVPIGDTASRRSTGSALTQRVERNTRLTTVRGAYGPEEGVSFGGQGVGRLLSISGGSSSAELNAQISQSGAGAIIFASGDIAVDQSLILMANQHLVGGGGVINLTSTQTGVPIALRNDGATTTLRFGASFMRSMRLFAAIPDADIIKLADGSIVSDLAIQGGGNAIVADGTTGARVENVTINGSSLSGISAVNATGLSVINTAISKVANSGVALDNSRNVTLNTVSIFNAGGNGLSLAGVTGLKASDLAIMDAGDNAILAENSSDISLTGLEIRRPKANGIMLRDVEGVNISKAVIADLPICQNNTLCEFAYARPNAVPNSAINAIGASKVTIRDVALSNVTYGAFFASKITGPSWDPVITNASTDIAIDNLSVMGSRREALMFVGVDAILVNKLTIDNTAMDRSMDLVVFQSSGKASVTNSVIKGGVNGLMFVNAIPDLGLQSDVSVSNVVIADTDRSGVFFNPITNISLKDVTINNAGSYGFFMYGGWAGPVADINLDNVVINGPKTAGVFISGPLQNVSGNLTVNGNSKGCEATKGPWSGTEITQDHGEKFSINGREMTTAIINSDC